MPALYLGHGVLALVGLFLTRADEAADRTVLWVGSIGAALGVALFFLRHSGAVWRTTEVDPGPAVATGLAAAAAWLLLATERHRRSEASDLSLVGVASTSLILFALNRWTVPALLFWMVASIALAALVRDEEGRAQVWFALVLSDVLVVAGLVWHAIAAETWRLPASADGLTWWFVVAGAAIRSCAFPKVGAWAAVRSPALPLVAGSALALVTGVADREQPWLGLAFVAGAIAIGLWGVLSDRFDVTVIGAWPSACMFCVLLVVPGAPWQAAAASLLALTAVLLWPRALGRAQIERGLLLAFIPPLAGFSALVAAAVASFDRATATTDVLEAAPWTGVTALLPLIVATGVILGARMGRTPEPEQYEPAPVLASWLVFGLALVAGLWPRFVSPEDPRGGLKVFVLHLVALAVAAVAARFLHSEEQIETKQASLVSTPVHLPPAIERVVAGAAAVIGAAVVAGVGWFTLDGLRVGFL